LKAKKQNEEMKRDSRDKRKTEYPEYHRKTPFTRGSQTAFGEALLNEITSWRP
jgi:hypothetical protein